MKRRAVKSARSVRRVISLLRYESPKGLGLNLWISGRAPLLDPTALVLCTIWYTVQ